MSVIEAGTKVSWVSQSQGSTKAKEGRYLGFLPANEDLFKKFPELKTLPKSRIKAQKESMVNRHVIAVPRPSGLEDIYLPTEHMTMRIHNT